MALANRDVDAAHAHLGVALTLARTMGYQQSLVDEGPELWDLLRSVRTSSTSADYIDQLLLAAAGSVPSPRPTHEQELIEPLSERELTVLRYLSSKLDGREIAVAMYLSVNTVRSHIKAIYRKLDVNSRAEAVRRARTLGLI